MYNATFIPEKVAIDLPFDHKATEEDIQAILNDPNLLQDMNRKNIGAQISICSITFQPYKVIDGIRYDLELLQDTATACGYPNPNKNE